VKVVITIDCDNAEFEASPMPVLARLLQDLARRLRGGTWQTFVEYGTVGLFDLSGNKVGEARLIND